MKDTVGRISEYINNISIVDTHEHLPVKEEERDTDTDVLKEYLSAYFYRDLISAGLPMVEYQDAVDPRKPLMKRWDLVEQYWEASRSTGYGRILDHSAKELYGISKICKSTIEQLDHSFKESFRPGHFRKVLMEKSKIRISFVDNNNRLDCDPALFRAIFRIDNFINVRMRLDLEAAEQQSSIRICSFDDWLGACEKIFNNALEKGVVAFKCALAYHRALRFERVTRQDAEREFNRIFQFSHVRREDVPIFLLGQEFQDYMMHHMMRIANRNHCTIQFHTGMQDGHGNLISNSDPALLSNLFLEYPDVSFDILHSSYPYGEVLGALSKTFPNVFINMSWEHAICASASIRNLEEWLDTVPITKISAFGGDYPFIDGVCGHQHLARQNVAKALARKVDGGEMDMSRAEEIAEQVFEKNPIRINKLTLEG